MNTETGELRTSLRIIGAIAVKDIVDAIKNKTTISVVLGVAVLMLSAQAFPIILRLSSTHQLVVYDAGSSGLLSKLRRSPDVRLIKASSQPELEEALAEGGGNALGLVIPADFDRDLEASKPTQLDAYHLHWVSADDAAQERAFFEALMMELTGQSVRIKIEEPAVYPGPDSGGQPYLASMTLVVAIITISGFLVPYLMIEEKETKTLHALLVSPARVSHVVIGKAIAGTVYGLVAAGVVFAFHRALVVHWGWAILAALCATLFAVAVGLLLGSAFDNPQNMSLWVGSVFIVLLMPVFLGVTALTLPDSLSAVMAWIPSTALAKVVRTSFARTVPLDQVLPRLGVAVGCAVLLLAVVIWIVRRSDH